MLLFPESARLHSLSGIRRNKAMLPGDRGLYSLFFRVAPGIAPTDGCFMRDGASLLYIGTAGADLAKEGNLRNRLWVSPVWAKAGAAKRHATSASEA